MEVQANLSIYYNVGKTVSYPWLGMVIIPPTRMLMTGGWFMIVSSAVRSQYFLVDILAICLMVYSKTSPSLPTVMTILQVFRHHIPLLHLQVIWENTNQMVGNQLFMIFHGKFMERFTFLVSDVSVLVSKITGFSRCSVKKKSRH